MSPLLHSVCQSKLLRFKEIHLTSYENVMDEGREVWKDGIMFTSNPPHISSAKLSREPSEVPGNEQSCCRGVGNSSDCMGGKITTWPWTVISLDLLKSRGS